MKYLIGIDIGTQGTKAAVFSEEMDMLATAFEASRLITPEPGTVWQEPDDLYASCAHVAQDLILKTGIAPGDIAAIGLDGQMAGIMGIDHAGEASTYYDSWLDTRCEPQMRHMNERAGKRVIELSGGPVTYVHGPKILWWRAQHPEVFKRTAKFIPPHAYVVGRMCSLDAEHAYYDYTHLHFSCFSDNARRRWSDELLECFDVPPGKMARIASPFEVVGTVSLEFARMSSLIAGTPVVAGCGDTAASTFGSGMFECGNLLDIAGTASALCGVVDHFRPDVRHATLTTMRSPVDGLYLPLAYIGGGGLCIRWFRDELTGRPYADYDALGREAEAIACGSDGLCFIPHFAGRVLPLNPRLKGAFIGLDFTHTRAHMYRAILESIAYEYASYLDILHKLHPEQGFDEVLSVGGGAKSDLFNQIKADVLGVPVTSCEMGETALIGDAVIAGVGVGLFDDHKRPINKAIRKGKTYAPRAQCRALYAQALARYAEALKCLTGLYEHA